MSDVRESFDKFDKNGNGKIDLAEFRLLMTDLGDSSDRAAVEVMFDEVDDDETGMIEFEEFEAWWAKR